MSYRIIIDAKDGQLFIEGQYGRIPNGSWEIGGHEDKAGVSINVNRKLPDGKFAAEAQHYISYDNYNYVAPDDEPSPMLAPPEIRASGGITLGAPGVNDIPDPSGEMPAPEHIHTTDGEFWEPDIRPL